MAALERESSVKEDIAVGPDGEAGTLTAFVEVLEPSPRLLICGAGHDAIPVARYAAQLGWRPVVIDDRERFLNEERFGPGIEFIGLDRPLEAAAKAGADRRTYVLVMSHNYLRDRDYIASFLGTDVAYIGSLGPRKRLDSVLTDLAKEGVNPSDEDLAKIYAPAGLDVGAIAPAARAGEVDVGHGVARDHHHRFGAQQPAPELGVGQRLRVDPRHQVGDLEVGVGR